MNFYRVAMKVFREHNKEFVDIALKREKLKRRIILKRIGMEYTPEEKIIKLELEKEIKEGIEKLNKIIGEYLK